MAALFFYIYTKMEASVIMQVSKKFLNIKMLINLVLSFVLLIILFFYANTFIFRIDLNNNSLYDLSPRTLSVLNQIHQPILITVLFQDEHSIYEDLRNLLHEYQIETRMVKINWVDPIKDRSETEALADKYSLNSAQVLIIDDGQRYRVINASEIISVEKIEGTNDYRMIGFLGERLISNSILELIENKISKIYFIIGHGELGSNLKNQNRSISKLRAALDRKFINSDFLNLSVNQSIPDDADVVVIAGPTKEFNFTELNILERYLDQSGRLFILHDALMQSGLSSMMRRWGAAMQPGFVVDPKKSTLGKEVNINRYTDHPICRGLEESTVQFFLPRAILPTKRKDLYQDTVQHTIKPILMSSESSWLESSVLDISPNYSQISGDIRGPLTLGLAIEKGGGQGLDVEISSSRLVVLGDSDFINNEFLIGANKELFLRCVDWLLSRDDIINIPQRMFHEVKLTIDGSFLKTIFTFIVVGIPFLIIIIGIFVAVKRRY